MTESTTPQNLPVPAADVPMAMIADVGPPMGDAAMFPFDAIKLEAKRTANNEPTWLHGGMPIGEEIEMISLSRREHRKLFAWEYRDNERARRGQKTTVTCVSWNGMEARGIQRYLGSRERADVPPTDAAGKWRDDVKDCRCTDSNGQAVCPAAQAFVCKPNYSTLLLVRSMDRDAQALRNWTPAILDVGGRMCWFAKDLQEKVLATCAMNKIANEKGVDVPRPRSHVVVRARLVLPDQGQGLLGKVGRVRLLDGAELDAVQLEYLTPGLGMPGYREGSGASPGSPPVLVSIANADLAAAKREQGRVGVWREAQHDDEGDTPDSYHNRKGPRVTVEPVDVGPSDPELAARDDGAAPVNYDDPIPF